MIPHSPFTPRTPKHLVVLFNELLYTEAPDHRGSKDGGRGNIPRTGTAEVLLILLVALCLLVGIVICHLDVFVLRLWWLFGLLSLGGRFLVAGGLDRRGCFAGCLAA